MNKLNIYNESINNDFFEMDSFDSFEFCKNDSCKDPKCPDNDIIRFDSCELCKKVSLKPFDISSDISRLLKVTVCIKNVCIGNEITIGCIIMDKCNNILAYKSMTFTPKPCNDKLLDSQDDSIIYKDKCTSCTSINKTFSFILPKSNICIPLDIKAKVIANYTSPCNK